MTKKAEKISIKKYILIFIIGFILYFLFNTFIWEKYFYTPTPGDALENQEGRPGVFHEIDRKNEIAVLTLEDAFHVYTISKSVLGWKIKDDISFSFDEGNGAEEPYTIRRENMTLHKNKEMEMLMVITRDPEVWYVKVIGEDGKDYGTNGTQIGSNVSFYYIWNVDGFDENLRLKMYSHEDKLLYEE